MASQPSDPELHQVLTAKLFPKQADVVTVEDWPPDPAQYGRANAHAEAGEAA